VNEIKNMDWDHILERLQKNATSNFVKQKLSNMVPLNSAEECNLSFENIIKAQEVLSFGQRPFMESLDLCSTWFPRLQKKATLKTLELKDIRHFCLEALALKEVLNRTASPWSLDNMNSIMPAEESLSAIDQIMTSDGGIRTDASELLYSLHEEKIRLSQQVQKTLDKIVHKFEMEPILQDRYVTNREGRWVLPVKSGMQHNFEGLIHASSQSKQTVYMEPQEIVPINNRLRTIEQEIEDEIERLLKELSEYLSQQYEGFLSTKEIMSFCDEYFAKAQLSDQIEASTCQFTIDEIELLDLRNPVLIINKHEVVPNTIRLDKENRILILSGPNAGGKTVLLKSVGLAAQMSRCGLPICAAKHSKIPFFKEIVVAVGDAQNVDEKLSTFAAHLKVLNHATTMKGFDKLFLVDEICGSTDPEEGGALAKGFIDSYSRNQIFAVITSHLGALKKGWENLSGIINGSLEFDKNKGPTYNFLMGVPGQSLAIQTARRVGVSENVINKAIEFLSPEHRKYQESLKDVEFMKNELSLYRTNLQIKAKEAEETQAKYQKLFQQLQSEKEALLEKALKEAELQLNKLIQEAKVKESFRKHDEIQKIKSEFPQILKANQNSTDKSFKIESAEEFSKRYPPGSKVYVTKLGADGIIQGIPNSKGEVPILSNSMRLVLPWTDLKPPETLQNPTAEVLRKTSAYKVSPADSDRIIDLRGLSIEEAQSQLERQLDTAVLNQEDRVKIVHGHGTEAIKRAIRSYLSRSSYVKKWSAGTKENGGDGVTWAELC